MNTFQDQEYDEETGWVQFKWRNHQPEIGRFFNVDPLAESYVYNSPYAFSENRVINGVELEGLEYISTFDKFQYTGGATDYLKAIPNAATDVVNYGINLYNTAAGYATGDVNIIQNEAAGVQAIGNAASGAVDYLSSTSGSQMLSDVGAYISSPDFFGETAIGALFGGATKLDNLKAPSTSSALTSGPSKSSYLGDLLNKDLGFQEKSSLFNADGALKSDVIGKSNPIINGTELGNANVVEALKGVGGNLADWNKMSYSTGGKNGIDVHFYHNSKTGQSYYGNDYKSNLGSEYNK